MAEDKRDDRFDHGEQLEDEGAKIAQKLVEEAEAGARYPTEGWQRWVIPIIAASWSIFQLLLAEVLLLNADVTRAIHLAFAIVLVYLSYPLFKKKVISAKWLSDKKKFHTIDFLLAAAACLCALYIAIDYDGLAGRQGSPILRDILIGTLLVVLLLEAARRALGPALTGVAGLFIFYAFFGPYMPDIIAFKGVSLNRFFGQITMSTEGIYGVPLDVSAKIVFLFVLFGATLEKAGGGEWFVKVAYSLLGHLRGGPAKAAVLASGLSGMVSGSSIANVVTTGTFTIPLMKDVGYPDTKAAAVEVAASTNGQLMPPIMGAAAFIIAEYCNINYFEVVKHAFIPAVASYCALFYITHLEAGKLGLKGAPRSQLPSFFKTLIEGIHFVIPLLVLIWALLVMRYSPEKSAFWSILVLYGTMIVQSQVLARREGESAMWGLKVALKTIWDSWVAGGRNMLGIGVAVATAGIIVGVVTMGLGNLIMEVVDILAMGNLVLLLMMTAMASLILGMGLPTTANYIVVSSLMAPVIVELGPDMDLVVPLIAAHLFVFYFGILADDTPPVGLAAYAASAIAKSPPIPTGIQGFIYDIRTAILPFMFIFNTQLLLIGIHDDYFWFQALYIFCTTVIAMFAFACATQGFFVVKAKWWERIVFLFICFVILRPDFFAVRLFGVEPIDPATGQAVSHFHTNLVMASGMAMYGLMYLLHRSRLKSQQAAA